MATVQDIDKGWKDILRRTMQDPPVAKVGFQDDGEPRDDGEMRNIDLGVIHEFGYPDLDIPERSFIRSTFDANVEEYAKMLESGAKLIVDGKATAENVVGIVGERVVGDIKNKISEGIPPPNTPGTIQRKGSSTPLIDSSQMKNAVEVKVTKLSKVGSTVDEP